MPIEEGETQGIAVNSLPIDGGGRGLRPELSFDGLSRTVGVKRTYETYLWDRTLPPDRLYLSGQLLHDFACLSFEEEIGERGEVRGISIDLDQDGA